MGNSLGRKSAKIMKIDGETLKFKTPARVADVLRDYPDHVLMDSEAVRHLGVRAKALEPHLELKPRRLYFLVQLPKIQDDPKLPRRVRSGGIHMSAKERLETLMLARRSVSDLSSIKSAASVDSMSSSAGSVRLKMRLPKAQIAKVMEESSDEAEAARKIIALCSATNDDEASASGEDGQWKPSLGPIQETHKTRQKRGVRFQVVEDGESV